MTAPDRNDLTLRLLALAEREPVRPVVRREGRVVLTFAELGRQILRTRAALARWDLRRGDIVAGTAGTREVEAALLLAMPASSTYAPMASSLDADAYEALLSRLVPRAVVLPAGGAPELDEAARRLGIATIRVAPSGNPEAPAFELALDR